MTHPIVQSAAIIRARNPFFRVVYDPHGAGIPVPALFCADSAILASWSTQQRSVLHDPNTMMLCIALLQQYAWTALSGPIAMYVLTQRVPSLAGETCAIGMANGYPDGLVLRDGGFFTTHADPAQTHPDVRGVLDRDGLRVALRAQIVAHFMPVVEFLQATYGVSAASLWVVVADMTVQYLVQVMGMVAGVDVAQIQHEANALVADPAHPLARRPPRLLVVPDGAGARIFHQRESCCFVYRRPGTPLCRVCPRRSTADQLAALRAYVRGT